MKCQTRRTLALFVGALFCALLSSYAAALALNRGQPLESLALALGGGLPVALMTGAVGFVGAWILLRRVPLQRAIPIVAAVTIAATASAAWALSRSDWLIPGMATLGLLAGLGAMVGCRARSEPGTNPSRSRAHTGQDEERLPR